MSSDTDGDGERDGELAAVVASASAASAEWAATLERCIPAIVALRVSSTRPSEQDGAGVSYGTGFVVDAENGFLLTNRHVVGTGPVRVLATFDQHEELDIDLVYRDPLHDFAVLRFDPAGLFLTRKQVALPLSPSSLRVGVEVRVVGNDDGEKLQILQGTVARVDRNAPNYSEGVGDENTFYAGCGSNCSGGASGSPVVNIRGEVVAILAGGSNSSACDFFLPLDRVQYAVERLRQRQPVPRGTIRVRFLFETWAQLRRLGFSELCRDELLRAAPGLRGLLVVEQALEGSAAQALVVAGDVLLGLRITDADGSVVEDRRVQTFTELEASLDAGVGRRAELLLSRGGEELRTAPVPIEDLFGLSSNTILECGGSALQDMSYSTARAAQLQLGGGVLSTESGFIFGPKVPDQAIITDVAGQAVRNVQELAKVLPTIREGSYFEVRYIFKGKNVSRLNCKMCKMLRLFAPMVLWREHATENGTLRWERSEVAFTAAADAEKSSSTEAAAAEAASGAAAAAPPSAPTLARVIFRTPCELATDIITDRQETSGTKTVERAGVGFLARPGIVVTDRHAVPQPLGDVEVTFNQEVTVQARVLFIHPEYNLVLLQIPPLPPGCRCRPWLDGAGGRAASPPLQPGDPLKFVGLDPVGHEVVRSVSVAVLALPPPSGALALGPPRFAERNCELLTLAEPLPLRWSGLLLQEDGDIAAFYSLFACHISTTVKGTRSYGIPKEALLQLMACESCRVAPDLGVEFEELTVAALRNERGFGRPDAAGAVAPGVTLAEWQPSRHVVLSVARVEKGGPADGVLREGDVLVRAAGGYVREGVLALVAAAAPGQPLPLEVFRSGALATVDLVPAAAGSDGAERVAIWHGLVCVHTPRALRRAGLVPASLQGGDAEAPGVYVVRVCFGSPAQSTGVSARVFLLEVDGRPVRCLGDLPVAAASASGALGGDVRLRTMDHFGREGMETLRPDPLFWRPAELRRQGDGSWQPAAAS